MTHEVALGTLVPVGSFLKRRLRVFFVSFWKGHLRRSFGCAGWWLVAGEVFALDITERASEGPSFRHSDEVLDVPLRPRSGESKRCYAAARPSVNSGDEENM